jgi:hypothetical protein
MCYRLTEGGISKKSAFGEFEETILAMGYFFSI